MAKRSNPLKKKGRPFKPSKTLQKKYKSVQKKYEEQLKSYPTSQGGKEENLVHYQGEWIPYNEAKERGILGSKVRSYDDTLDVPSIYHIALLSNEYGLGETAELLGLDENFLDYALRGGGLSRISELKLNRAYADFAIDNEDKIDLEKQDKDARELQQAIYFVDGQDYEGTHLMEEYLYGVAEGRIDAENIQQWEIWAELTTAHKRHIFEWFSDETNNFNAIFDLYRETMAKFGNFWQGIHEGANPFWNWYKDTFSP